MKDIEITKYLSEKLDAVRCMRWLGEWVDVPENIAKCPECGSPLSACVDGWSERDGFSITLLCLEERDEEEDGHRYWQGEWQKTMDVVKAWANSPSDPNSPTANS